MLELNVSLFGLTDSQNSLRSVLWLFLTDYLASEADGKKCCVFSYIAEMLQIHSECEFLLLL